MSKDKRKWCLPATCSLCKRTCTQFWGECADMWACDGHQLIMESNRDSYDLKYLPTQIAFSKMYDERGYVHGNLTEEQRSDARATQEYKDATEDPAYVRYIEKRKKGKEWLKANPEPEEVPVCSICGEEAKCQDKGEFFCLEHWPLKEYNG